MIKLDDTDAELLALLRSEGRMPVATLAKKLRVARGTVQNRMSRLEREGVIVGYTVRLKPQAETQRIRALMTVAVEGNCAADVLRVLRGIHTLLVEIEPKWPKKQPPAAANPPKGS